jgi:hypothetical protein
MLILTTTNLLIAAFQPSEISTRLLQNRRLRPQRPTLDLEVLFDQETFLHC